MIEVLAIPAWRSPPVSLDEWVNAFTSQGLVVALEPDPPDGVWMEIAALRLRGLVLREDDFASVVHFELSASEPDPARAAIELAAAAVGWETHDDDDDETD
jgi:hypothetical protein